MAGPGPATRCSRASTSVHADTRLPDRVVVVGHCAGGHLVLWVASSDHAPWVTGVLALARAADLAGVDRLGLSDDGARGSFGGRPDEAPDA